MTNEGSERVGKGGVLLGDVSGSKPPPSAERISAALRGLVEDAHQRNAKLAIVGPDERGAFPERSDARAWGLIDAGVPRVVADANELRGDVIRTCRAGRTVLVTSANVGALRFYLASHVVGEMAEHGERWAIEAGVCPEEFLECWRNEYLPLARVVADGGLSLDLLGPVERARVEHLLEVDPDDAPSAILALCLGAFFLSHDRAPLEAVYGEGIDIEAHRAWLRILRSSGDAGELGKLVLVSAITPTALVMGAFEGGRWISRRLSPWALAALILGGALLAYEHVPGDTWHRLRSGLGAGFLAFGDLYVRYLAAHRTFAQASAPAPSWPELTDCLPTAVLCTRACMSALAAGPSGARSSAEFAEGELARLGVEVAPQMLERYLADAGCFRSLDDGLWQLGHPAEAHLSPIEPDPATLR
jgi:hypothetical protein